MKKTLKKVKIGLSFTFLFIFLTLYQNCSDDSQFSLSSEEDIFALQNHTVDYLLDILWVIDNSSSMLKSQANLARNFTAFIKEFQKLDLDFQIAVTTTDAWLDAIDSTSNKSVFKNGNPNQSSGFSIITKETPDIERVFNLNVSQGIAGWIDERGLHSMKVALSNPKNHPFPRPGATMAVIFLTDNDDASKTTSSNSTLEMLTKNPLLSLLKAQLDDIQIYYDYLFEITESTEENQKFIVSIIGILDAKCQNRLNSGSQKRPIAQRYIHLAKKTGGFLGDLCGDFSHVLSNLTRSIIRHTSRFILKRIPVIDTITVHVDGQILPQGTEDGWTFDEDTNTIIFHQNSVPKQNSSLRVDYTPVQLK